MRAIPLGLGPTQLRHALPLQFHRTRGLADLFQPTLNGTALPLIARGDSKRVKWDEATKWTLFLPLGRSDDSKCARPATASTGRVEPELTSAFVPPARPSPVGRSRSVHLDNAL